MQNAIPAPAVVLVRPQEQGNIGASARAMANMGLDTLVLVDPVAELGRTAYAFAVGAREILDRATTVPTLREALEPYRRIIGTTSARSRELPVPTLLPSELPKLLAGDPAGTSTALVFGPEASGLNNEEMSLCSALVCVPCAPLQPTLNLSQAVLILAYELRMAALSNDAEPRMASDTQLGQPASTAEIEGLFDQLVPLLEQIGYIRDDTAGAVLRDLRRLAAHGLPTSREIQLLRGICRRAAHALARTD